MSWLLFFFSTHTHTQTHTHTLTRTHFFRWHCNRFLNGHEHNYERNWPVYKFSTDQSNVEPKAPIYIVTGAAGCTELHEPFTRPQPPRSAFRRRVQRNLRAACCRCCCCRCCCCCCCCCCLRRSGNRCSFTKYSQMKPAFADCARAGCWCCWCCCCCCCWCCCCCLWLLCVVLVCFLLSSSSSSSSLLLPRSFTHGGASSRQQQLRVLPLHRPQRVPRAVAASHHGPRQHEHRPQLLRGRLATHGHRH